MEEKENPAKPATLRLKDKIRRTRTYFALIAELNVLSHFTL
jgi:hypothetical protein